MRRWAVGTALVLVGGALGAPYVPGSPVAGLAFDRLFGRASSLAANPFPAVGVTPTAGAKSDDVRTKVDAATASPTPTRAAPGTARSLHIGPVQLSVSGYWSWAMIDRRTGQLAGSANLSARSDTASMIKSWIAADYLRRATERGRRVSAGQLKALSLMIRDSDNAIASEYDEINGGAASIKRLVAKCGLTDTVADRSGTWSTTKMSARDAARLGVCIGDGRAAGPQWTSWLLNEMRQVRGAGRFGIVQAFPADVARTVSIKNGWILRKNGKWYVNCLAVTGDWALAVMTQYPGRLGQGYGSSTCRKVAEQLGV
jgi:hypothetical protein